VVEMGDWVWIVDPERVVRAYVGGKLGGRGRVAGFGVGWIGLC